MSALSYHYYSDYSPSSQKIPGSLIAIVVVTLLAVYLMKTYGGIDCIQTIGDRFTIKSELPDAVVPAPSTGKLSENCFR